MPNIFDRDYEQRGYRQSDYRRGREDQDQEERGFFERAGDEVRSWFGDEEAERRRRQDQQRMGQGEGSYGENYGRSTMRGAGAGWDRDDDWRGRQRDAYDRSDDRRNRRQGADYSTAREGYGGERRESGSGRPGGYREQDYGRRSYGGESYRGGGSGRESYGGYRDESYDERSYNAEDYGGGDYGNQQPGRGYRSQESSGYVGQDYRMGSGDPSWSYSEFWLIPGPFSGRGPQQYQRSDDRIADEVNDRLTRHGLIDASRIQVSVMNGEVTLTGTVNDRQAKYAAEDTAESVMGVKEVHNQLRVSQSGQIGLGESQQGSQNLSGQTQQSQTSATGQTETRKTARQSST